MSKKLELFLKEHGAYENFLDNLGRGSRGIDEFEGQRSAISRAFVWGCTPQGDAYWRNLDYKYRHQYESLPSDIEVEWDNMWEE